MKLNEQSPTWYLPALADETLRALRKDATQTLGRLQMLAHLGEPSEPWEAQRNIELCQLIERELIYRQTMRLANSGSGANAKS